MDPQEALRTIRTLTRIALDTDSMSFQQMPLPTCFGALCKVVVVAEKVLHTVR
jgi:hypothetical protein